MYGRLGVSVIVREPAGAAAARGRRGAVPVPARAPESTQAAIVAFSAAVSCRCPWPRYGGDSGPGIHGGMRPAATTSAIRVACRRASRALVSAKGAIPPAVWQPAHFERTIGPTSRFHVGGSAPSRAAATTGSASTAVNAATRSARRMASL